MKEIKELSALEVAKLVDLKIERVWIDKSQIESVKKILNLEGKSIEELRETRNSVVKTFFDFIDYYREEKMYVKYDEYMATMSGTTATIDSMIFEQGGEA